VNPRAGIVVFPGSNCDRDLYHALERAGFRPRYLWHGDTKLPPLEAVFLPGGFSYGDYLRPGAIARFSRIMPAIEDFWREGGFVMGICNGFQILVEAGWLPGALLRNQPGRFICTVTTIVPQLMPSHPLRAYLGERPYRLPIAHGDGRYVVAKGEIPPHRFRYLPIAPNGSQYHIAGLVNAEGTVLGLMPHPERACDPYQGQSDGLDFLRAIARYVAFRV